MRLSVELLERLRAVSSRQEEWSGRTDLLASGPGWAHLIVGAVGWDGNTLEDEKVDIVRV